MRFESRTQRQRTTGPPGAPEDGRSADMAEVGAFEVDLELRGDLAVVRPVGELDVATREQVESVLAEARGNGATHIVLDLAGLTFLDSAGLNLMASLHRQAVRDRFRVVFIAPPPPADAAIALSGIRNALPFAASVEAAVAG